MKNNFLFPAVAAVGALLFATAPLHAQGTAFTYQGRLNSGGNSASGSYDFRFRLAADPAGNNYVGGPVLTNALPVANGLFTVTLDFGAVFSGSNYWLEVDVKSNGTAGYPALAPLQSLTPAPYAEFAAGAGNLLGVVPAAGLSGTYGNAVTLNNPGNNFSGNGSGLVNLNADNLASGTVPAAALNNAWKITGNAGTSPGPNFIGTTDNKPLELQVNQTRALRLEPGTNVYSVIGAPNVIGGAPNNFVDGGIFGATIAGGGAVNMTGYLPGPSSNHVSAIFGAIGGGRLNTVGADHGFIGGGLTNTIQPYAYDSVIAGGTQNTIQAFATGSVIAGGSANTNGGSGGSSIGGGYYNTIQTNASLSTVGGGYFNTIGSNSSYGSIGGGYDNTASGYYATVGGGGFNVASGQYATVPGGEGNHALGDYSFAAGWNAYATHYGSFVWSDQSSSFVFGSTTSNQFSARAFGGVNFSTGGAGMTLDGQPVVTTTALSSLNAANLTSGTLADARLSANVALRAGGNTFAGQQTITGPDAGQLFLQNSTDSRYWYLYDESFNGSGALIFQPSTGVGAYIRRSDGNYIVNSDERLKRDIAPLGEVLDRVLQLRPVSYRFKSAPEGTPLSLGLIAQEVKPLFPDVVGERNGMMSMAYTELVPVIIRAIQELNQKLESDLAAQQKTSEVKIQNLEKENEDLRLRLEKLEQWMARTDVAAK